MGTLTRGPLEKNHFCTGRKIEKRFIHEVCPAKGRASFSGIPGLEGAYKTFTYITRYGFIHQWLAWVAG